MIHWHFGIKGRGIRHPRRRCGARLSRDVRGLSLAHGLLFGSSGSRSGSLGCVTTRGLDVIAHLTSGGSRRGGQGHVSGGESARQLYRLRRLGVSKDTRDGACRPRALEIDVLVKSEHHCLVEVRQLVGVAVPDVSIDVRPNILLEIRVGADIGGIGLGSDHIWFLEETVPEPAKVHHVLL